MHASTRCHKLPLISGHHSQDLLQLARLGMISGIPHSVHPLDLSILEEPVSTLL